MDKELVTTEKGVDSSSKLQIEFKYSQSSSLSENMRGEIEKGAHDVFLILSEMGLSFPQKIPLTIVNESDFIDMHYGSRSSYQNDCINLIKIMGFVDLKKDNNGKWRDKIVLPTDYLMQLPEKYHSVAVLPHELAHVWMFQETQFGKEIFSIREHRAEQKQKDHDNKREVIITFGEINPEFHDIISDIYFKSLSVSEQFNAVGLSLKNNLKEAVNVYDILSELFSQKYTINSIKRANKQVNIALQKQEYDLKINYSFIESLESTNHYIGKRINKLEKEKDGKSKDEKLFCDSLIHILENERDNEMRSLKIDRLFLEKGCHQFYTMTHTLLTKIKQGINVHTDAEKLQIDLVSIIEKIILLQDVIEGYKSEPCIVSADEIQRYQNFRVFIEGFAEFVEEKFIDEYRRRNPDTSNVLSNDKMNTDELLELTNTKLLPYITGLALFKKKYTSVSEAVDAIRTMSIDEIQKEFLS